METVSVDGAVRKSESLPPINYLDLDRIKTDGRDPHQKYQGPAAHLISAPPLVSPTTMYSGPPPPYSYPSSAITNPSAPGGYISPPESRRTSDDDKEHIAPHRQSLPSIHEALGVEKSISYSAPSSAQTTLPPTSFITQSSHPATAIPRSHPEPPSHSSSNPFSHPQTPVSQSKTGSPLQPQKPSFSSYSQSEPLHPRIAQVNPPESRMPTLQPLRTSSPATHQRPGLSPAYHTQNSAYEQGPSTAGTMNSAFGYTNISPYSHGSQNSSVPPSAYPSAYPHQDWNYPPPWKSEQSETNGASDSSKLNTRAGAYGVQPYGESVKRHLDIFDLEVALNEISENSERTLQFSRHYGVQAHRNQRAGPAPGSLPTLSEVDEMMRNSARVSESLARLRELIISQQHAMAAEQRAMDQSYKAANNYEDERNMYPEDFKGGGGFAGADPKKRRGRAAPPGRCHSCNRAETPEWRRGPDGARTLCNACGLHYAKLTRKMGSKPPIGSSNLRPKNTATGSPQS